MESLPINIIDLVILIILLISAALAFFRGFVHEVLSIGSWVGAFFVTLYLYFPARDLFRDFISIEIAADIAAGASLFLISLFLLSLLSRFISKRMQESSLGALDRTLGIPFGLARGALIAIVIWLILDSLLVKEDRPVWVQEARSLPLLERGSVVLISVLPSEWVVKIRDTSEEVQEKGSTTIEDGQKALDATRTMQELLDPQTSTDSKDSATDDKKGYTEDQREGLDQLIEENSTQ